MSLVCCVKLEDRIAELQAGIAAALQGQREARQQTDDHKLQLDSLRESQTHIQVSVCVRCALSAIGSIGSICRMRFKNTVSCYRRRNSN